MKKKVANHSLVILVLIVSFGLFQAWRESRNPFAFYSKSKTGTIKAKSGPYESVRFDTKSDYTNRLYFKK